ncbi:MAG: tail fiber protein [Flavobacteriales bacterium]|jgi:phage-related tail fiber protein
MANVTETPTWENGIYRIETSDPVIGGENGVSNAPHKQLANRTSYLKVEQDTIKGKLDAAGVGAASLFTGDLNNLRTSGFHFADTGHTNGPGGNGHVIVDRRDDNSVFQVFSVEANDNVFIRKRAGGTWGSWRRVLLGDDAVGLVQPGTVISHASSVLPSGYLKCNGASVSRTTYQALFNSIGLQFSNIVSSQTGIANVTGQTATYVTGNSVTVQPQVGDTLPSPLVAGTVYFARQFGAGITLHPTNSDAVNNTNAITLSVAKQFRIALSNEFTLPDLRSEFIRGWDDGRGVDSGRIFGSSQADEIRSHTHGILQNGNDNITPTGGTTNYRPGADTALGGVTGSTGGAETRPRNIALSYFIKF